MQPRRELIRLFENHNKLALGIFLTLDNSNPWDIDHLLFEILPGTHIAENPGNERSSTPLSEAFDLRKALMAVKVPLESVFVTSGAEAVVVGVYDASSLGIRSAGLCRFA